MSGPKNKADKRSRAEIERLADAAIHHALVVAELVRAGRVVVAHWHGDDGLAEVSLCHLIAALRNLTDAEVRLH